MRQTFNLFIPFILILGLCGTTCSGSKEIKSIELVEFHSNINNKGLIITKVKFPQKFMTHRAIVELAPIIVSELDTIYLKKKYFQGEKVKQNFEKVSFIEGGEFHWLDSLTIDNTDSRIMTLIIKARNERNPAIIYQTQKDIKIECK